MLNSFQKTTLIVSTVLLIIALIITGVLVMKALMNEKYPPIISDCPDYWDVTYNSDKNLVCKNVSTINRGRSGCNNYPVSQFLLNGSTDNDILCEKYKWSKKCDIAWDGVTNNKDVCQNTTF